jgi:hypothetical protein
VPSDGPFTRALIHDSRRVVLVRRVVLTLAGVFVSLGLVSAWRAWFQVKSLKLTVSATALTNGATLVTDVVSYARTSIDVRIELVQGTHVETLGMQTVPGNWDAGLDPRTRSASQTVAVSQEVLARFAPGPAIVRATAIGRPQWLRVPPPLVREAAVEIAR